MKKYFEILILSIAFVFLSCNKTVVLKQCSTKNNFENSVKEYLEKRRIEPMVTINFPDSIFTFENVHIEWKRLETGLKISVNKNTINTEKLITKNDVWGKSSKDSINFANTLQQIKFYNLGKIKLLGFVLTNSPCTGLGCGVNYQIIYDLNSKKTNCFGRFRTGDDLELYNFDDNDKTDYLSKTFFGRNTELRDTTEFNYYQRNLKGEFEIAKDKNNKPFFFKHMYSIESDTIPENFEEKWVRKIIKE